MVELDSKLWVDSKTKKQKNKNRPTNKGEKNLYRMYVYLELFYIWFNNWKWGRSILLKVVYGFNTTLYFWQVSPPSWWRMLLQPQAEMKQIHSFPTNPQTCASERKKKIGTGTESQRYSPGALHNLWHSMWSDPAGHQAGLDLSGWTPPQGRAYPHTKLPTRAHVGKELI